MEMRKHASWYLKDNGGVRKSINGAETRQDLENIRFAFVEELEEAHRVS